MRTERIILRPRTQSEAMDLGFHLVRANWPAAAGLVTISLIPAAVLAALAFLWSPPLALLALWWFKPSLDRPVLEMLARDLTGRQTRIAAVLGDWRTWWTGGHMATLLPFRWHPARGAVLPVWQLERLTGSRRRDRTRALAHGDNGSGTGLTMIAGLFELSLTFGFMLLISAVLPREIWSAFETQAFFEFGEIPPQLWALIAISYAVGVILVEPFYVGAGFGIYLNQRCRLECWDLEPVLRKLAERHPMGRAA